MNTEILKLHQEQNTVSDIQKHEERAAQLDEQLANLSLCERLALVAEQFPTTVFTSSLGIEDQVMTHFIAIKAPEIDVITLQTGRLFPETLDLISQTQEKLNLTIKAYEPEPVALAAYIAENGENGFYDSVEARHACCYVRKVEPLKRSLAGADAWITGLRRAQSDNRGDVPFAEWNADFGVMKFNLLADWTVDCMNEAVKNHSIPINPLHQRGYPSIGCEPCTRAIKPGESERAGRWWWENDDTRECGLHVSEEEEDAASSVVPNVGKDSHV